MSENLPVVANDFSQFEKMMEVSKFLAQSDLIPAHFKGKQANVFIALEFAMRHQMSPFLIMQGIYVVHGKPGLEAKLVIAMANKAGWHLQYDIKRDSSGKIISCKAWSEKSGVKVYGPEITWDMVNAEGWSKKEGSKWRTMPELMFPYRAGTYFVRLMCPEVTFGLQTVEELEDIEPISITTAPQELEPLSEPETSSPIPEPAQPHFDVLWHEYQGPQKDMVSEFLDAAAKHNKCSVDDMKLSATTNWKVFIPTFEKWAAKQTKKAEKQAAQASPVEDQLQTNGKGQEPSENATTGNVVIKRMITDDQIDQIEDLCALKGISVADALIGEGLPSELIKLTFEQAEKLYERLKAL